MFGHKVPIVGRISGRYLQGESRWRGLTHNPWIPIVIASMAWGSAPAANKAILLNGVSPFTIFPLKQVGAAAVAGRPPGVAGPAGRAALHAGYS